MMIKNDIKIVDSSKIRQNNPNVRECFGVIDDFEYTDGDVDLHFKSDF